ncbi:MAG: hypothetical protein AAF438_04150 [Pseudomonadota bacterium]
MTVVVWPLILGPESSPDTASSVTSRAAHLLAKQGVYLAFWTAESLAMCLLAASAFVIAFRGPPSFGPPLGWSLLGVGSLANVGMYPFVMGVYFVAAAIVPNDPSPYESAKAAAFAIFNIANAVAFLGLGMILASFVGSTYRLLPAWLGGLGSLACFTVVVSATYGLLTSTDMMIFMGPGVVLGYLLVGVIGFRITQTPNLKA